MATTNRIRALNRLPYDFEDGMKIGGVDVTSLNQAFTPAGAGLIGFTPVGGLSAGNVQAALAELDKEKAVTAELAASTGAVLVGYMPAGTGAVATTVQGKLRESVSITDKGDSLSTAFTDIGGSEGTGFGAAPVTLDLKGKTISFTGTLYVPTNVSIINGKITSSSGRLVWRNPHLANTTLRGYTEYWPYMSAKNSGVVFDCVCVINAYIGAKNDNCDFNGLVFVNSDGLWTEYNSFSRCSFSPNAIIGGTIRFDGNLSGTSAFSAGVGAGTSDGSFGYNNFEPNCKIDSIAPQVGIAVVDGATVYNCHLGFQGYARGTGPSGGFLYLDSTVNTSTVSHCSFEVHLESFGAAANVFSVSANSRFWYNTGTIHSASPEMVMAQDATADLRENAIRVIGVVLQDGAGAVVFNGQSRMTNLKNHVLRREWAAPAFSVYVSSNAPFNSNEVTTVPLSAEEFDTESYFSSNAFTPKVAGYYQIYCQVKFTVTASCLAASLQLFKNGTVYRNSAESQGLGGTSIVRNIGTLVYMNGSTDYIDMRGYVFDNAGTPSFMGGAENTFMNGHLVRVN